MSLRRDGIDVIAPDERDWLPASTCPIAVADPAGRAKPVLVEGKTHLGQVVRAYYYAAGDYVDRWSDATTGRILLLTHWRHPITCSATT